MGYLIAVDIGGGGGGGHWWWLVSVVMFEVELRLISEEVEARPAESGARDPFRTVMWLPAVVVMVVVIDGNRVSVR